MVGNRLLAALPRDVYNRLVPHLEVEQVRARQIIHKAGDRPMRAHFPTTAVVSLHYVVKAGDPISVASVGSEGMVDTSMFLDDDSPATSAAIVQIPGEVMHVNRYILQGEFERCGALHQLLLRYTHALMTQMALSAVCNRYHVIDQRLCRWLLVTHDQVPTGKFTVSQELISDMLGVRREGITEAMGRLQRARAVYTSRNYVEVVDRFKLEKIACECYDAVKQEFRRVALAPLAL